MDPKLVKMTVGCGISHTITKHICSTTEEFQKYIHTHIYQILSTHSYPKQVKHSSMGNAFRQYDRLFYVKL
jgi:hypothetical protein